MGRIDTTDTGERVDQHASLHRSQMDAVETCGDKRNLLENIRVLSKNILYRTLALCVPDGLPDLSFKV